MGLEQSIIEGVFSLLGDKPEKVQLAFYYRACGETYKQIGDRLNVSGRRCNQYIENNCKNIYDYLFQK